LTGPKEVKRKLWRKVDQDVPDKPHAWIFNHDIPETEATPKSNRKGKVQTRKRLTLLEKPIGDFIYNYYLPAIEKYSYHRPHVIILGKKHCGEMRSKAFKNVPGAVKTRRYYAERLSAAFDLEIQSEHFGNGRLLSMEGSSVEFHLADLLREYKAGNLEVEELEQQFEFISHFSDVSRQDSTTTNAHMDVLEEIGMREGLDHDEEASLGDASWDGSSSEEEDGSHSSDQE
jgi:hypothetical protein